MQTKERRWWTIKIDKKFTKRAKQSLDFPLIVNLLGVNIGDYRNRALNIRAVNSNTNSILVVFYYWGDFTVSDNGINCIYVYTLSRLTRVKQKMFIRIGIKKNIIICIRICLQHSLCLSCLACVCDVHFWQQDAIRNA